MQKSLLDGIIWLLFLGGLVGFVMALLKLFGGGTPEEYGVLGIGGGFWRISSEVAIYIRNRPAWAVAQGVFSRAVAVSRREVPMTVDKAVFAFAGVMVLLSVALAYLVSPWWLLLTVFVGANLVQSAFTGFCPAAIVFKRMGFPTGQAFN